MWLRPPCRLAGRRRFPAGYRRCTSTVFPDAHHTLSSHPRRPVWVTSAVIPITSAGSRLNFRNLFNTEANFDGLVLEISINGGVFKTSSLPAYLC